MVFFRAVFDDVAQDYPAVEVSRIYVTSCLWKG
jgi:isocitrate/isopropylmalate dehydrogenase